MKICLFAVDATCSVVSILFFRNIVVKTIPIVYIIYLIYDTHQDEYYKDLFYFLWSHRRACRQGCFFEGLNI
jgi:hypothetical protein